MLLINKKRYVNRSFDKRNLHTVHEKPLLTVSHRKPVNPLLKLTRWFPRDVIVMILAKLTKFDVRQCLRAHGIAIQYCDDDVRQVIALNITGMFHLVSMSSAEQRMMVKHDRVELLRRVSPSQLSLTLMDTAIACNSMQCLEYLLKFIMPAGQMSCITTCEQLDCIHAKWPQAHIEDAKSSLTPLYTVAARHGMIHILEWLHVHDKCIPPEVFSKSCTLEIVKKLVVWGYKPTKQYKEYVTDMDMLDNYICLHEAGLMDSEYVHYAARIGSYRIIAWYHGEYGVPELVLRCGHVDAVKALARDDVLPENAVALVASGDHEYRLETLDYLQSRGHQLTALVLADAILCYRYRMIEYLCAHKCPSPDIDFLVAKLYDQGDVHGMRVITRILETYNYM